MDKSAVLQIQESANIGRIIEQINEKETKAPVVAVPNSMSLESLEQHMPNASHYRMLFNTSNIEDFIKYSVKFKQDGATCFINQDEMTAKTIFDIGTTEKPLHKNHKAVLLLRKTAEFKALLAIANGKKTQKEIAEFLETWSPQISILDNQHEPMEAKKAIASIRNLTIETAREVNTKVHDFGQSMSAMEKIEAKNQNALPAEFSFDCRPYHGLNYKSFNVKLSILTSEDAPRILLRIPHLEITEENMAIEFKERLQDGLEDYIDLYIGIAG